MLCQKYGLHLLSSTHHNLIHPKGASLGCQLSRVSRDVPCTPIFCPIRDLPCGVYRLLPYSDHLVALLQMRADTTAAAMDEDTCNPITSLMCISFTCCQRPKISCGHFWCCLVGLASVNMSKPANMDKPAKRQIYMNSHCIFTQHHAPPGRDMHAKTSCAQSDGHIDQQRGRKLCV